MGRKEADQAISEMNGKKCPGSTNVLIVKYADDTNAKKNAKTMIPPVMPPPFPIFPAPAPSNDLSPSPGSVGPVRNQATSRYRYNPMARDDKPSVHNQIAQQASYSQDSYPSQYDLPNPGSYSSGYTSPESRSIAPSPRPGAPKGPGPYSIFVFNIPEDTEERDLWALFAPFGSVMKCTVMMDHEKKTCKGFGFVDIGNVNEASNAIMSLNGGLFKGRKLNVSFKKKTS